MKPVPPKCSAAGAGAIALIFSALATWRRGAFGAAAFAPAGAKGMETHALLAKAASPALLEVGTAKPTAGQHRSARKKGSRGNPSKGKKGSKRNTNKPRAAATNATQAPKRKNGKQVEAKSGKPRSFKPLKDLKLGSSVSGRVVDVCDFGAFVDIGHATRGSRPGAALLHISQLSDQRVGDVRDFLKVGDIVEAARVIRVDLKRGEVGLSLRPRRPARRDFRELRVGARLEGRVASVLPYGAFVDVGASVNGLLHISRITGGVVENVRHHLNEGDVVSVHVIDMDKDKKTMAVSMLDKKADQYLDRRMSQRLKRYYGSAAGSSASGNDASESSELEHFDMAIRELEEALRSRGE